MDQNIHRPMATSCKKQQSSDKKKPSTELIIIVAAMMLPVVILCVRLIGDSPAKKAADGLEQPAEFREANRPATSIASSQTADGGRDASNGAAAEETRAAVAIAGTNEAPVEKTLAKTPSRQNAPAANGRPAAATAAPAGAVAQNPIPASAAVSRGAAIITPGPAATNTPASGVPNTVQRVLPPGSVGGKSSVSPGNNAATASRAITVNRVQAAGATSATTGAPAAANMPGATKVTGGPINPPSSNKKAATSNVAPLPQATATSAGKPAAKPAAVSSSAQADRLIAEAWGLIERGDYDPGRIRLRDARKAGDDMRVDFSLGLLDALINKDWASAEKNFAACVRRNPDNAASLNNLAIANVHNRHESEAARHWKTIIDQKAATLEVVQNLGRTRLLVAQGEIRKSASLVKQLDELYTEAAVATSKSYSPQTGYRFMALESANGKPIGWSDARKMVDGAAVAVVSSKASQSAASALENTNSAATPAGSADSHVQNANQRNSGTSGATPSSAPALRTSVR
jgi:hypothetical protein